MVSRTTTVVGVLVIILILASAAYFATLPRANRTQSSETNTNSGCCSTPESTTTFSSTSSQSSSSVTSPSTGNADWITYHGDGTRSGFESMENITLATLGWSYSGLDGRVYAEPLVLGDTVYVATENDSVYAIDTLDGSLDWRTNLGAPVSGGSLPCGNIDPSGITSTPVIDNATETIYVVAFLNPAQHVMFGLDTDTGTVVSQVNVDPPGADPTVEQQRGALALSNGVVYIPYGGLFGDCGNYHGWVVGAVLNGSSPLLSYEVPTHREGGIWASGGVALDEDGNVVVATGNGDSTSAFDYGESVIRLSPSLGLIDYFAPTNWAQLNLGDTDVGSLAPTVLPDGDIFQAGKEGIGYLLSGNSLGGLGGQVFSSRVCLAAYGGTAHVGQTVFLPCTDGMVQIVVGASNFTVGWKTPEFTAGSPIVTGNVVWVPDIGDGTLRGYDVTTGKQLFSLLIGSFVDFTTPSAGNGMVFVAAGSELYSVVLVSNS